MKRIIVMMVGEDESTSGCLYRKQLVADSALGFSQQIRHSFIEHQQAVQDRPLNGEADEGEFLVLRCLIPNADGSAGNEMEDWDLQEALMDLLDP